MIKHTFYHFLFAVCFMLILGKTEASNDMLYFEERLSHLQKSTSLFKKKQDIESLKEAVQRTVSILTELNIQSEYDLLLIQKELTPYQSQWAMMMYRGTVEAVCAEAYDMVQTTIPRYLTFLSEKEYHKSGKKSPRKLAFKACDTSDISLEFARKEYVTSRLLAISKSMYELSEPLSESSGCVANFLENFSKTTAVHTHLSELFWSVEEALLHHAIKAQKKGFLRANHKKEKELNAFWQEQKNGKNLSRWTFSTLNERVKLFYFSYARFIDEDTVSSKNTKPTQRRQSVLCAMRDGGASHQEQVTR
ncbi:MAG: hypothetical protein H2057_02000 [Alphaproteobacteria bacterium]|nr:hypothetical protein [Alphaproteobacteria bacterium]